MFGSSIHHSSYKGFKHFCQVTQYTIYLYLLFHTPVYEHNKKDPGEHLTCVQHVNHQITAPPNI